MSDMALFSQRHRKQLFERRHQLIGFQSSLWQTSCFARDSGKQNIADAFKSAGDKLEEVIACLADQGDEWANS